MPHAQKTVPPLLLIALITFSVIAQKKNAQYQYHLHKTSSEIKVDGVEDDLAWRASEVATDFYANHAITLHDTIQNIHS